MYLYFIPTRGMTPQRVILYSNAQIPYKRWGTTNINFCSIHHIDKTHESEYFMAIFFNLMPSIGNVISNNFKSLDMI